MLVERCSLTRSFFFIFVKVVKHPSIVSSMTVVYLPSLSEITGISQNGCLKQEELTRVGLQECMIRECVTSAH